MRRSGLALVATLTVTLAGCGNSGGVGGPSRGPDPSSFARQEATRLMSLVHVPADATTSDHSPAKILNQPAQVPGVDDLVDEHRWWTVPADAETTLAWLQKNGVKHLKSSGSGTSGGPAGVEEYTLNFADRAPAGISSEEVQLNVAPMSDGTSAIRADAQVVWLVNRATVETIPRAIDRIDVSAFVMGRQIGHRVLTGGEARRLAMVINALPTAVRGEHGCGMDQGYQLRVVAGPLVFKNEVACFDIAVTYQGHGMPALAGDEAFVHAVASSMGLPDHPSHR